MPSPEGFDRRDELLEPVEALDHDRQGLHQDLLLLGHVGPAEQPAERRVELEQPVVEQRRRHVLDRLDRGPARADQLDLLGCHPVRSPVPPSRSAHRLVVDGGHWTDDRPRATDVRRVAAWTNVNAREKRADPTRAQKAGSRRTSRRRHIRSPVPELSLTVVRVRRDPAAVPPLDEVRLGRRALNRRPMRPVPWEVGTPLSSAWKPPTVAGIRRQSYEPRRGRHDGSSSRSDGWQATCRGPVARVQAQVTGCPLHQEPALIRPARRAHRPGLRRGRHPARRAGWGSRARLPASVPDGGSIRHDGSVIDGGVSSLRASPRPKRPGIQPSFEKVGMNR